MLFGLSKAWFTWALTTLRLVWRFIEAVQVSTENARNLLVKFKGELFALIVVTVVFVYFAEAQDTVMVALSRAQACGFWPTEQYIMNLMVGGVAWVIDGAANIWNQIIYTVYDIVISLINNIVSIPDLLSLEGIMQAINYIWDAILAFFNILSLPGLTIPYVTSVFVQLVNAVLAFGTLILAIFTSLVKGTIFTNSSDFCSFYSQLYNGDTGLGIPAGPRYCSFMGTTDAAFAPITGTCQLFNQHNFELNFWDDALAFFNILSFGYLDKITASAAQTLASADRFLKRLLFMVMGIIDTAAHTNGEPPCVDISAQDIAGEILADIYDILNFLDEVTCFFATGQATGSVFECNYLTTIYTYILNVVFYTIDGVEGMVKCMKRPDVQQCFGSYPTGSGGGTTMCPAENFESSFSYVGSCGLDFPGPLTCNKSGDITLFSWGLCCELGGGIPLAGVCCHPQIGGSSIQCISIGEGYVAETPNYQECCSIDKPGSTFQGLQWQAGASEYAGLRSPTSGRCCCSPNGECTGLSWCTQILTECMADVPFFSDSTWSTLFTIVIDTMIGVDTLVCPFEIAIECISDEPAGSTDCSLDVNTGDCSCSISDSFTPALEGVQCIGCGLPLIASLLDIGGAIITAAKQVADAFTNFLVDACEVVGCFVQCGFDDWGSCLSNSVGDSNGKVNCVVNNVNYAYSNGSVLSFDNRRKRETALESWQGFLERENVSRSTSCGDALYAQTPYDALSNVNTSYTFYHFCLGILKSSYRIRDSYPENFTNINGFFQWSTMTSTVGTYMTLVGQNLKKQSNYTGPKVSHSIERRSQPAKRRGFGVYIAQTLNATGDFFNPNAPASILTRPEDLPRAKTYAELASQVVYVLYYHWRTSAFYNNTRQMYFELNDVRDKYRPIAEEVASKRTIGSNVTLYTSYASSMEIYDKEMRGDMAKVWLRFINQWNYDYGSLKFQRQMKEVQQKSGEYLTKEQVMAQLGTVSYPREITLVDIFARQKRVKQLAENITKAYENFNVTHAKPFIDANKRLYDFVAKRFELDNYPTAQGVYAFLSSLSTGNWPEFADWYAGRKGYLISDGYVPMEQYEARMSKESKVYKFLSEKMGFDHWSAVQGYYAFIDSMKERDMRKYRDWYEGKVGYLVGEGYVPLSRYDQAMEQHAMSMNSQPLYRIFVSNESLVKSWRSYAVGDPRTYGPFLIPWTVQDIFPSLFNMSAQNQIAYQMSIGRQTARVELRKQKAANTWNFENVFANFMDFLTWLFVRSSSAQGFWNGLLSTLRKIGSSTKFAQNFEGDFMNWLAATLNCHYPEDINGTNPFNGFCLNPIFVGFLPQNLIRLLIPQVPVAGNAFLQPQIQWPAGFYDPDFPVCTNVYNGNPGPVGFRVSDNCGSHDGGERPFCGDALPCDYCVNYFLTCADLDWNDGFDSLLYLVAVIPRMFNGYMHDAGVPVASVQLYLILGLIILEIVLSGGPDLFGIVFTFVAGVFVTWIIFTTFGGVIPYGMMFAMLTVLLFIKKPQVLTSNVVLPFILLGLNLGWVISFVWELPDLYININHDILLGLQWLDQAPILDWFPLWGYLIPRFQHFDYPEAESVPLVDTWCFFWRIGYASMFILEVVALYIVFSYLVTIVLILMLWWGEGTEGFLAFVENTLHENNAARLEQKQEEMALKTENSIGFIADQVFRLDRRITSLAAHAFPGPPVPMMSSPYGHSQPMHPLLQDALSRGDTRRLQQMLQDGADAQERQKELERRRRKQGYFSRMFGRRY